MSAFTRLALDGGPPGLAVDTPAAPPANPSVAWPQFTSDDDLQALRAAHRGTASRHGRRERRGGRSAVTAIERQWARATGCDHVIACSSLFGAHRLLVSGHNFGPGDEVIVAVGSAGVLAGLGPNLVEVDLDPETLQIDPRAVEAAVGDDTVAIVAHDRYGTVADHRALSRLGDRRCLVLVEDGSESIGASLDGRPVGALGSASVCVPITDVASLALGAGALLATSDPVGSSIRRSMAMDRPAEPDPFGAAGGVDGTPHPRWALPVASDGGGLAMGAGDAVVALEHLRAIGEATSIRAANGNHLCRLLRPLAGIWSPTVVRGASHVYHELPLLVVPDELGLPEALAPALRATIVDCLMAEGLWVDPMSPPAGASVAATGVPSHGGAGRFPVAAAVAAGGLVVGRGRNLFAPPNGAAEMERVADCFTKILVDNVDRVRQLSKERAARYLT